MPEKLSRQLSNAARMWVVADQINPPFVNQMVLEGNGDLDIKKWKRAVKEATIVNPGSRLLLRGHLGKSRWIVSNDLPVVREVDGNGWDGLGPDSVPFLREPLSPVDGPTCEVLLIHGTPCRIAFRTHHAVMDGRGTMTWAEDIFRSLRGEPLLGSDYLLIENDLLNLSSKKINKSISCNYAAPTGMASGEDNSIVWKRINIKGIYSKLLSQIALLIAKETWANSTGRVRIGVPVDLRTRRDGLRSTSNLTNAIYIEVNENSTLEGISEEIAGRIKGRDDGVLTLEDKIIRFIPLKILKKLLNREIQVNHKSGNYRFSGFISNLGRMSNDIYSGGGFTAFSCFFIPPGMGFLPFFLGVTGMGDSIDLVLTIPRVLADNGRIEKILEKIASGLK